MVSVTYVTHDGRESSVDVPIGHTLMEGAIENGVDGIEAVCGGNCYCGTCRIYLSSDWLTRLPPAEDDELAMIEASEDAAPNVRLACQVRMTEALEGIRLTTPEFQK
jgi:2Fe-2S ferredoxin